MAIVLFEGGFLIGEEIKGIWQIGSNLFCKYAGKTLKLCAYPDEDFASLGKKYLEFLIGRKPDWL